MENDASESVSYTHLPGGPGDGGEATSSARANPADEPFENANLGFEDLNI